MKTKSAFDLNNSCDIKSDEGIIKSGETIVLFYVHLKNNHICYEAYGSYLGGGERAILHMDYQLIFPSIFSHNDDYSSTSTTLMAERKLSLTVRSQCKYLILMWRG